MDLKQSGYNVAEGYNFGSPAVGDDGFAMVFDQLFHGRFFRVTHGKDPFVDMPPSSSYVHCSPEIYYQQLEFHPGDYVVCDGPSDTNCSAQNFPDWQKVMTDASFVQYHHNYMGVDTTAAGCKGESENCEDDIEGSW